MAIGPRLDLRQSQSLVMTPQLQQAIRLLALSNLEIESFIAEELEKNPLLESRRPATRRRPADEAPESAEPGRARPAPDSCSAASGEAPLDLDLNNENLHQDSAADRGLDGGLGLDGLSERRRRRRRPGFRQLRRRRGLAPRPSARAGRRGAVGHRPRHRRPDHRADRRDRLFPRLAARPRRPARARRSARSSGCSPSSRASIRPGVGARIARRMPRHPGEGGRPLRSGHGAADRQSRLSRQGQSRRP